MTLVDLYQLAPMLALVLTAAVILVVDLASSQRRVRLYTGIAVVGVLISILLVQPVVSQVYGHSISGLLAADALSVFLMPVFSVATLLSIVFSLRAREVAAGRHAEYLAIVLIFSAGLTLVVSATHLLMLYLAMETIGISAYALTAFDANRERSAEAGLKYAIFGAVASGVMLFGMSMLFGMLGGLSYAEVREGVLRLQVQGAGSPLALMLFISVVFVLGGFLYKVAAFPFHAWCPDAYEGAPTPFTALMSVAPKAAGLAALARFFLTLFGTGTYGGVFIPADIVPWPAILGVVSVLTMTFGNFAAITQQNLKRMLAYSSIAHAGYMLMGIVALSRDGIAAMMAYIVIYLVMNMGAFFAVLLVAEATDGESISDFAGMSKKLPLLAASFAVFLLSLTGLPPFAGFVGKFYLFAAVMAREGTWYFLLALAGVLNSVVSLYYYARVLRVMYLEEPQEGSVTPVVHPGQSAVLAGLALVTLVLGLYWNDLVKAVSAVSRFV